ncbi:MAG: amidohydrolase [Planctomycetota bacterium]
MPELFSLFLLGAPLAQTADASPLESLDALYPALELLYLDLHQHPELSFQEERTAARMAASLRGAGFTVTEGVGGHGVVGVLENGTGPTVLVRTDLDALPIREQTGLPYASGVTATSEAGETVPVMHACGHDVHMTAWVGAATLLAADRERWRGTLVFVGQPAEERGQGAQRMVDDGLLTRFPPPDFVLGLHVASTLPAGQVGVTAGPASAASTAVDITFHGRGGHGAMPHQTVDPVVMAARAVVAFQTIVAREVDPFEPAVITVGTFHAGTKRNIIPDEARLELTVRSYSSAVQAHLLAAIDRIARAEAMAANAPRDPDVVVHAEEATEVVINDPALAARLMAALQRTLGEACVVASEPVSTSEDFGVYGRLAGVPGVQLRVGAIEPAAFARAQAAGESPPGPHSPLFAPDRERTIRTGVAALVLSARDLLCAAPGER